jgi:hypothetical protein
MTSSRLPLARIVVSVLALVALVVAAVLLGRATTVDFGGSVYRIDSETGIGQPESSYDVRLECAANLAGPGEATSADGDDDTYGEDALLDGGRLGDDALPTQFAQLEGELHVDRTDVLATCDRVRAQRLSVAVVLVALALAALGAVGTVTVGRRRTPV